MDPRAKIIFTAVYIAALFVCGNLQAMCIPMLFIVLCYRCLLYTSSSQSSSEPESSSQAQPSSQPEQSSESSSSGAQVEFGVPVPESERVRSDYFNDAVFIGDSLTTGIELYNILPDTTVLASTGINLDTIDSKQVIGTGDSKLTIPDALRQTSNVGKIYILSLIHIYTASAGESEVKLIAVAAAFLGRQMEE